MVSQRYNQVRNRYMPKLGNILDESYRNKEGKMTGDITENRGMG